MRIRKRALPVLLAQLVAVVLPLPAVANDYPTLDRVDHVLTCMVREGGQTVDNLYACVCELDTIAGQLKFDEFVSARTFDSFRRMPGERGGVFRDSADGNALVERLNAARAEAGARCFLNRRLRANETGDD